MKWTEKLFSWLPPAGVEEPAQSQRWEEVSSLAQVHMPTGAPSDGLPHATAAAHDDDDDDDDDD